MAKFAIMASELKSLKKSMEDRKLAELKKEIIEILKKQDEKDFKKAIDYFESQELHFTHLEKSLVSGKWIEKAGYGVGTVRIWKGKKYKKIAPGKWARVFDKEGRGTNIAIGKLIAKVNKIDNAEDLLQFVIENKQRFIDEEGKELSIINKVRAAVDARNEKLSGESKPYVYGVGEEVSAAKNEMFSKKDKITKEEADLHKISRKYSQIPTSELKQRKAKLDRWIENKTRNKRDRLNNAIFKDSYKNEVEAINKELEKRSKGTVDNKVLDKYKTDAKNMTTEQLEYYVEDLKNGTGNIGKENLEERKKIYGDELNKREGAAEKKEESETYWIQDFEGNRITSDDAKKKIKGIKDKLEYMESMKEGRSKDVVVSIDTSIRQLENYRDDLISKLNPEDRKEIESEAEKKSKTEENKESQKEEKTEKIYRVDNSGKVISFDELQPIATNKSVGENEVQMPYSKDLADEIESLKNCTAPKWEPREFLKHVFYKDGKFITTDARRMKFIEVGELEGIPNGSYVDINTDKSGINIKKIDIDAQFPNYSKVVPDNLNQTATLDTKLVKDKIKEMYKDGAISKKGSNLVQLEFRDGKVFIDDTPVGEAKDIKMKYSDDWGPARNDTNYMTINADYFVNALSGKTSVMQIGERADKAIAINTGSTSNILMPMSGTDKKTDYSKGRSEKEKAKADKAAEIEKNKEFNKELCKVFESKYGYDLVKNMVEHIDERLPNFSDENLKREYTRLGLNFDKLMEKNATTINTILDKKTSTDLKTAYLYSRVMKEHPEVKEKIAAELEKRGISVKKSLFDDFIVDVFEADDEDELEQELYEGETEYNDYSAEQPELFNSTAMKVREALDRIRNQVL